jgi:hypothetical protein
MIGKDKVIKDDNTSFADNFANPDEFAAANFIGSSYNKTLGWFIPLLLNIIRISFQTGVAYGRNPDETLLYSGHITVVPPLVDVQPDNVNALLNVYSQATDARKRIDNIIFTESNKIFREEKEEELKRIVDKQITEMLGLRKKNGPLVRKKNTKNGKKLASKAAQAVQYTLPTSTNVSITKRTFGYTKKGGGATIDEIKEKIYKYIDDSEYIYPFDDVIYGNEDENGDIIIPESIEKISNYIDSFDQYVDLLSNKEVPPSEDIIFTLQKLILDTLSIAADLNTDKEAHLVYALPAILRFSSVRDPNKIIEEYTILKGHPYISNSVLPAAHGIDVYDAVASILKDYTYKTVAEVKELHTEDIKTKLKNLFTYDEQGKVVYISDDETLEVLLFFNEIRSDFRFVPDFHRYYGVEQGDIAGIITSVIRDLLADTSFKPDTNVRAQMEEMAGKSGLSPEEIAKFHATNLIGPLKSANTYTTEEFNAIVDKYLPELRESKNKEDTIRSIRIRVRRRDPTKQFTSEQEAQLNTVIKSFSGVQTSPGQMFSNTTKKLQTDLVSAAGGARRKSRKVQRRKRVSRKKTNRRTQSRPRKTQRLRRDRIRHED